MAEKSRKPKIRFAGFTEDWEQRRFSDQAETRRGLTYKPSDVANSGIRVLRSSNIDEDIFICNKDDVFVNINAINISYVKNGDILITSANGSSRLVGKHAIIQDITINSTVHGGFMLIASANNPYFLNASMSSLWYSRFISLFASGGNGAIGNLNKKNLDEQFLWIPCEKEQTRIGTFFRHLDHLITLHQRKRDRLVNIKKAMLEKMFPKNGADVPEVRFAGFTEAWEQREFGDIVTPYADPVPTPTDGYYRLGIRSHAKGTFHNYVRPGMELGTAQMHRVAAGNFIVNITFGWEHAVAITDETDDEKLVSHRFPQFSFNIGMVPDFFKFGIMDENFRHHLWLASPGGAGRNRVLKINEMLEYKFWVPSADEQRRIAVFLENLDRLITLHQRKVELLQNIKKACLETMFV